MYNSQNGGNPDSAAELMAAATISTKNLGWIQEYLSLWRLLCSVSLRLVSQQAEQTRIDEETYNELLKTIALATRKADQMQDAYDKAFEKHTRLMDRILEK